MLDQSDPIEPMDSIDSTDAMDGIDAMDSIDQMDPTSQDPTLDCNNTHPPQNVRIDQVESAIREANLINHELQSLLDVSLLKIKKLKFENKFLVETLHQKNDALFNQDPYSPSKRLYQLHKDSDSEDPNNDFKRKPRKRKTKAVDPNAPKRPLNVFSVFSEFQKDLLKQERLELEKTAPDSADCIALKNISKAVTAKWKNINEDEKQVYREMYRSQVESYEKAMEEYVKSNPDMESSSKKIKTDPQETE